MNLKNLSSANLLTQTKRVVREERAATTVVLHHLLEVERRRLYASLGYSSLFDYAVAELGYCKASAYQRISAARALREFPEIETKIDDGALNLTLISKAQTICRQERLSGETKKEILVSLENKSTREAEQILSHYSLQPLPRENVRVVTPTQSEVKFLASEELLQDLEKLKGLLEHSHSHASISELIQYALKAAIREKDPAQKSVRAQKPTVTINKSQKNEIWKRDQSQCTYQDPKTGRRCASRYKLQIDHRVPLAQGGSNELGNLRLLCQSHNLFEARRILGNWVGKFA